MAEPAATKTQPPKSASGRLVDIVLTAIPPLVSAVGIVTFVALVGGAIQWVRFWSAGLPADQAVRAMPNHELVVIGAVSLVGALLAGVLVVLVAFLINRQSLDDEDFTPAVVIGIALVEMAITLLFVEADEWEIVLLAIWFVAVAVVAHETLAKLPSIVHMQRSREHLWRIRSRFERASDAYDDAEKHVKLMLPNGKTPKEAESRSAALRAATVELDGARRAWDRVLDDWKATKATEVSGLHRGRPATKQELRRALAKLAKRERNFRRWGPRTGLLLATIAAGAVPLLFHDDLRWLLAVLAVAGLLAAVNFMVARVTRFAWYGLAVFASVTLFGATLSAVDTIRAPKVQPVAVLRTSDDRPICGAYVTESEDRVYIARVVSDPEGDGTESKLGRVFWVDLDDVDTVSIGPLQEVRQAADRLDALAAEIVADQAAAAPVKPKLAVETTTRTRRRGQRTVTVKTVRELPPAPATGDAASRGAGEPSSCTNEGGIDKSL